MPDTSLPDLFSDLNTSSGSFQTARWLIKNQGGGGECRGVTERQQGIGDREYREEGVKRRGEIRVKNREVEGEKKGKERGLKRGDRGEDRGVGVIEGGARGRMGRQWIKRGEEKGKKRTNRRRDMGRQRIERMGEKG